MMSTGRDVTSATLCHKLKEPIMSTCAVENFINTALLGNKL